MMSEKRKNEMSEGNKKRNGEGEKLKIKRKEVYGKNNYT
jgi:hypothetical protein